MTTNHLTTRRYAAGTELTQSMPWGLYVRGRVLCADGRVRALARIAPTADTFFSVPAAVKVKGKTVSGYVTVEAMSGSSVDTLQDPAVARFMAYSYGKNADLLPGVRSRPANEGVTCPDCMTGLEGDPYGSDDPHCPACGHVAVGCGGGPG